MSETTLMTDAATTTEGATSQGTTDAAATAATTEVSQQQQATEGQDTKAADKAADGDAADGDQADKAEKAGAPEKYEFVKPEGSNMDDAGIEAFSEVAKELDLSQEAAQKILDKMAPLAAKRQADAIESAKAAWTESAKADKEFGGDKLNENLAVAKKALETFGSPELRTLLNESGLGNHPEIIRAFFKAGKSISEDRVVPAGTGAPRGARDAAKALYPSQPT